MGVSNQRFAGTRTLVVFPGALGDFVCFGAALDALTRRDGAAPMLLLKASLVPLVHALGLGTASPIEGPAGAWIFSGAPPPEADAFFGAFSSIECFTGFGTSEVERNVSRWAGEGGRVHPFRPGGAVHLAVHFLARVAGAGAGLAERFWRVSDELAHRGRALWGGESNGRAPLIVQPGSGARSKRWSREGFRHVAERIRREGRPVVVVLGPAERDEAPFWGTAGFAVVEVPPLEVLAGLLATAGGCLGNDSGTSHLAAAVGAPGVAVFGPTDERLWRPWSTRWDTVRPGRWNGADQAPDPDGVEAIARAVRARLTG